MATTRNFFSRVFGSGAFALALALLILPWAASAQDFISPRSLLNVYTAVALTNIPPTSRANLTTKVWTFQTSQQWQVIPAFTSSSPLDSPVVRISSLPIPQMQGIGMVDILAHLDAEGFPVVLANPLPFNNQPNGALPAANDPVWFQTWSEDTVIFTDSQSQKHFWRRFVNRGTGKCLADGGNPGSGGAVEEVTCGSTEIRGVLNERDARQLWKTFNMVTWKWDTTS